MKLIDSVKLLLFPERCPCCGEVLNSKGPCEDCEAELTEDIISGKVCKFCGMEKQFCECKRYHYLFEGIAAPYYNKGAAKSGVYRLKFQFAPYCADFFGAKMAEAFKARFKDLAVDEICIVPSHKGDLRDKPYDKVLLLAKAVAKELKFPLDCKTLKKVRKTEKQHDLSHDKRQANVKGAYKAVKRLDGKTVLLIDDIKTTGYTLNECSKQLRLAGAEKVYCLTALITLNKSCKDSGNEI